MARCTVEEMRDVARDMESMDMPANASALREGANRIEELEKRLRIWRDDYARSADGALVTIPVHQIVALVGEN